MAITLYMIDDHPLFRRGLVALLSQDERFKVLGEAGDIGEALRGLAKVAPDLILLDNHLPGVRGVDGIAAIKDACAGVRVLMLTVSEDEADLAAALQAGADGYLLKTVESAQLCESIVKVLEGESVVSSQMMSKLVNVIRLKGQSNTEKPVQSGTGVLSERERSILSLIARGDTNKVIARELGIAETTVKIHVQHILRKLNLSSRVQIAVYAVEQGLSSG